MALATPPDSNHNAAARGVGQPLTVTALDT